ncbi:MAG: mechanosensitive ion channel [Muribaculaceae bacterium]|nr:mechanosensitive ion channel [Muribaculaceae bacterium]
MSVNLLPGMSQPEAEESVQVPEINIEDGLTQIRNFSFDDFITDVAHRLVSFAINLAIAIAVFYIGKFVIKRIYRVIATILVRRRVDGSLCTFILSFVKIVMYFILIVTVIGILGIETSSFLALFASAGVAIGMALSGTLQNFAGGVLILLLKPYKVGDYIEAQGYAGTVREIQIFHTIITTYDNKAIIIPNGGLSTSSINNWSREKYRRVGWEVAISYGDSVEKAREAILALFTNDPRILHPSNPEDEIDENDPHTITVRGINVDHLPQSPKPGFWRRLFGNREKVKAAFAKWEENRTAQLLSLQPQVVKDPTVTVDALADSSVNLKVRAWVHTADYWTVFYDYNELIYRELPNSGVSFPFPQLDVHINPSDNTKPQ